jgi:ATP-dependent Clp protease adapter protein ClpS
VNPSSERITVAMHREGTATCWQVAASSAG